MSIRIPKLLALLLLASAELILTIGCSGGHEDDKANRRINRADASNFVVNLKKPQDIYGLVTALKSDNTRGVEFFEGTMDGLEWRAIRLSDQFGNSADAMICIETGKVIEQSIPQIFEKVGDPIAHWK